jgi:MoxR-like ATPase
MTRHPGVGAGTDRRDGVDYVMSDELDLAVRVADATGRPLLLRGEPGSGKSSLAPHLASERGWRYYEHVVTSRTQTTDLLWSFDAVRRLADAQLRRDGEDFRYVRPGALWWAMAPQSAARGGAEPGTDLGGWAAKDPFAELNNAEGKSEYGAVVLIDEIDKADPDVPNSLLVPLGSAQFVVAETDTIVRREPGPDGAARHLVVITTNEERELPQALLRRCVVVTVPPPTKERLIAIAALHLRAAYGEVSQPDLDLAEALAGELLEAREKAGLLAMRMPSTAEYLDAVHACRALGVTVDSDEWTRLRGFLLLKSQQPT